LGVAFIAEGEPFPQTAQKAVPSLNEALAPDAAVKEVADYFDYTAVRQGDVYLLTKRYSNPDDLPDVTPEECHYGLLMLARAIRAWRTPLTKKNYLEADLAWLVAHGMPRAQLEKMAGGGLPLRDNPPPALLVFSAAWRYYLLAAHDRVEATLLDMDTRPPLNPYFHWKTIGKERLFGYDTFQVPFIPLRDFNRTFVPLRTTPLPRPLFAIRNDINASAQDHSDPSTLSDQTKRYLDDSSKHPYVVSLTQAITALNKRTKNGSVYRVDPIYSTKHVTLVGTEKLYPDVVMAVLAAVYGLRVTHRLDGAVFLTTPLLFIPNPSVVDHSTDRVVFAGIPLPIYHAFRARVADGRPGHLEMVGGAQDELRARLKQEQFEEAGATMQNTAVRLFRYLAEPQVQAWPGRQEILSDLGERARNMFAFARVAPAFADACALVDCIPPPYVTDQNDFMAHVTIQGGIRGEPNSGQQFVTLSLTYTNPTTGESVGPVLFFDGPVPLRPPPPDDGQRATPLLQDQPAGLSPGSCADNFAPQKGFSWLGKSTQVPFHKKRG